MSGNLAIVGLCLDILGVFFIMLAVIVKSPRTMMRELLNVKVDRLKTFKHFVAQRLEAILGFLCVLIGSSLQIYALLAERAQPGRNLGFYLVLTLLTMALVGFLLYRSCTGLARWIFLRLFRTYAARYRLHLEKDEALLMELGEILEIPHEEEDTVESYARKIRARLDLTYPPRR